MTEITLKHALHIFFKDPSARPWSGSVFLSKRTPDFECCLDCVDLVRLCFRVVLVMVSAQSVYQSSVCVGWLVCGCARSLITAINKTALVCVLMNGFNLWCLEAFITIVHLPHPLLILLPLSLLPLSLLPLSLLPLSCPDLFPSLYFLPFCISLSPSFSLSSPNLFPPFPSVSLILSLLLPLSFVLFHFFLLFLTDTTEVQNATIFLFPDSPTANITCHFAKGSNSKGCVVAITRRISTSSYDQDTSSDRITGCTKSDRASFYSLWTGASVCCVYKQQ